LIMELSGVLLDQHPQLLHDQRRAVAGVAGWLG